MASRIILQVHDEVILEVPDGEREAATELTLDAMAGRVRPAGAVRGQPLVRVELGRRQGLRLGDLDRREQIVLPVGMPGRVGAVAYDRAMVRDSRNTRFFVIMLVGLLIVMYVGLMFVSSGDKCGKGAQALGVDPPDVGVRRLSLQL